MRVVFGPLDGDASFDPGMAWLAATDTICITAFDNASFRGELRIADRATGNATLVGLLGGTVPGGLNQLTWLGFDTTLVPALPFLDGFESGDTGAWTLTVP